MIKIGLIQGNGSDLVGGGSIQQEYNFWADSQRDIELTNYIHIKNNSITRSYKEKEIAGRKLKNVVEFNLKSDCTVFNDVDVLIILTYPFLDTLKDKELNSQWYYNALSEFKSNKNRWIGVLCYDYKKEVVLNNLGVYNTKLYELADKIWVNNKRNPLVEYLYKNSNITEDKFYFSCPQFMNSNKTNWKDTKDKKMNWLYYQGRSLPWKGWRELLPLSRHLLDYNLIFNGVLPYNQASRNYLNYVDTFYNTNQNHSDRMDYNAFYNKFLYRDDLRKPVELYGYYDPSNANEMTSLAGFAMYYTILNPDNNFFPEYALIDAVRNGTVVILPSWYFAPEKFQDDSAYKKEDRITTTRIIDLEPEEAGFLTYNYLVDDYKQLEEKLNKLKNDSNLYNEYREKAFNYMIKHHGANEKIRKFLNNGK